MIVVVAIPAPHLVAFVFAVVVSSFALVVIAVVMSSMPVLIGKGHSGKRERYCRTGTQPSL